MKPLLSILIATKNRVEYCINAIETILGFNNEDFELIIQDNTDDLSLCNYVKDSFSDSRLVYNYTPPPFSSIDNFNAAIELSRGEYLCLLGDDDGITENIFEVVRWAKENDYDSICPKKFIHYMWPNGYSNGRMVIPHTSNKIWRNNPIDNIQHLVEDGVSLYTKFNLPKLYHGIVKKSCLLELKEKNGSYLGGLSPDIYASVGLSSIVKKHIVIDVPLTIAGACPQSTTVDNTKGKHSGSLEDAPHLRNKEDYIWERHVPRYYSVQTIWAETALKSIRDNDIKVDLSKLNVMKILAGSVNEGPEHRDLFIRESLIVLKKCKADTKFHVLLLYYRMMLFVETNLQKVISRIFELTSQQKRRFTGVKNIEDATSIADEVLNKVNIKDILQSYKGETRVV